VRVGEFLDYPRGSSQIFLEKPLSPVQGSG
jgi:hypothetical protein